LKFLALEREVPGISDEQFAPHLKAEDARTWELYLDGVIRELYFRADRHEAVLVLECPDMDAARAAPDSLPLVREGLITFEIIPLAPYPGFARLFGDGG
jgi:muconolactone delta-isomerase